MNKTYAITDLHGQYDLWEQIKEYCDETDTIICLGDSMDRGARGLEIFQEMLADPRVTHYCGNHEEMFQICMSEYLKDQMDNIYWWQCNGGGYTYDAARQLNPETIKYLIKKIEQMPEKGEYINKKGQIIHLSHAGTALDYSNVDLHYFDMKHMNPYLWDRKHYLRKWPEGYDNHFIIHGHTPVPYMMKDFLEINRFLGKMEFEVDPYKQFEILNYSDGHKFCLDVGSFMSGTAALFDLDELKVEKYFTIREKENENAE